MSYVVLARKWRPMAFEDLIGQDHVARTLENAIKGGRVAHAFLFTGVRGVGKTTSARILAKALNCMGKPGTVEPGKDPGPTAKPCLECPACLEIAIGSDVDVREIDGASYNGVDEVRKLQEQLPYRPARDRYKIYIVDEVHMLSQSAWNAFLKTLEEPPPHVKFIFATTEVHKVPVTILSRVQRFDFKLIPTQLIAARLKEVLSAEGVQADDTAIGILAREAAGSMRDAMSLLDQVIAWGGEALTGADVARVLGVASHQVLHDIASGLVLGEPERCLRVVGELSTQGFDMVHVARDLLELLRDLVVAKVCEAPGDLLDLADEEKRDVTTLAGHTDADDLLRLHQGFSRGFDDVVRSGQPRAAFEMLLVRLCRRPPLLPIDNLVGRLSSLERRLSGGGAPSRSSAAEAPRGAPRNGPERSGGRPREQRPAPRALPPEDHREEPPAPRVAPPPARPREPLRVVPKEPPEAAPEPPEAEQLLSRWVEILNQLAEARPELAAIFEHAAALSLTAEQVVVGFVPDSVFAKQASDKDALDALTRAARVVFGKEPHVVVELDSERAREFDTVAAKEARERQLRVKKAVAAARNQPSVLGALEILGARIKDVKLGND